MKYFPLIKWKAPSLMFICLLMAVAISGMIIGSILYLLVNQVRLFDAQDVRRDMVQNTRVALEVMSRELRMAGYNPTGASFNGLAYTPTYLHIRADLNGDGETDGPDEEIRYTYEPAQQQIIRAGRAGQEPLADNIQAFTFAYLDQHGQPTTVSAHIRQIRLTVTARAAGAEASSTQHSPRSYTLTTLVNLRNGSAVTEHERS